MCIDYIGKWTKTEKDITAYKKVVKVYPSVYKSPLLPIERAIQSGHKSLGKQLLYADGYTTHSPKPGVFLYDGVRFIHYKKSEEQIIVVKIPKGTWIRRGKCNTIVALEVFVIKEIE